MSGDALGPPPRPKTTHCRMASFMVRLSFFTTRFQGVKRAGRRGTGAICSRRMVSLLFLPSPSTWKNEFRFKKPREKKLGEKKRHRPFSLVAALSSSSHASLGAHRELKRPRPLRKRVQRALEGGKREKGNWFEQRGGSAFFIQKAFTTSTSTSVLRPLPLRSP